MSIRSTSRKALDKVSGRDELLVRVRQLEEQIDRLVEATRIGNDDRDSRIAQLTDRVAELESSTN